MTVDMDVCIDVQKVIYVNISTFICMSLNWNTCPIIPSCTSINKCIFLSIK